MLFPTPTEYVPPSPHSFIAEGVTKGLGAVEEQRKELCGMSASCCIPKFSARPYGRVYLHNWLNCFSPTHIHPFTDASCLLSGHVPALPAGKLRVSVFRWQLLMPSDSIPCPLGGSSTSGFSPVVHSLQVGERSRSVRAPTTARDSALCASTAAYSLLHGDLQAIYWVDFPYDLPHARLHFQFFHTNDSVVSMLYSRDSEEQRGVPASPLPHCPLRQLLSSLCWARFGDVRRDSERLGQNQRSPQHPRPGLKPEPVQKVVKRAKTPCNPQSKL